MIQHGIRKENLQQIALEIFGICMNHAIRLEVEWIPQEWNKQADYISNLIDNDDWSLAESQVVQVTRPKMWTA